jgi:hypothetical protein
MTILLDRLLSNQHDNDISFVKACIDDDTDFKYWISKSWYNGKMAFILLLI